MTKLKLNSLKARKADGRKLAGLVVWDRHMAELAERAGIDFISIGDTIGFHLWGRSSPLDISIDELLLVCRAVRAGAANTLVSCDFPFGPLQVGVEASLQAAVRLVGGGGVDVIKLDGASNHPDVVEAVTRAGIPVIAQFGLTPQTALTSGIEYQDQVGLVETDVAGEVVDHFVAEARRMESAGAVMLDFTNSGPVLGPAVVASVAIPVVGGFGGGPWLDGRVRLLHNAVGYAAASVDDDTERYADVAKIVFGAIQVYADDVWQGRQVLGK
jgi:3-methyl-2-oxobutanoate hydroxymethyltransferase